MKSVGTERPATEPNIQIRENQPIQNKTKQNMTTILTILASLFLASAAHAGVLTGAAKLVGKIVGHGADNAVVHVATHYGDDAAKAVAHYGDDAAKAVTHYGDDAAKADVRAGGEAALHTTPTVARAVNTAVDVARVEARAGKPVVEAVHRAPIVRPMHVAAGGVAVGTVVAANNLTAGEREKAHALADVTRRTVAEHPELLPDLVRADGEKGFWNQIGARVGRGFEWAIPIFAVFVGLGILMQAIRFRKRRKPAVIDVTPENSAVDQPAHDMQ